jgi:hypothetical protein
LISAKQPPSGPQDAQELHCSKRDHRSESSRIHDLGKGGWALVATRVLVTVLLVYTLPEVDTHRFYPIPN